MTRTPAARLAIVTCAALLALAGCTSDGAEDPDDAVTATAGTVGTVVIGGAEYEPIVEGTFPVPRQDGDATVTVGIVSVTVSGPTTELRLVMTPSWPDADNPDAISVYDMLGGTIYPELRDVAGLRAYTLVIAPGYRLATDPVSATAPDGEPLVYQAFFPALEDSPETVDVVVHAAWPVFEDVPVTYED